MSKNPVQETSTYSNNSKHTHTHTYIHPLINTETDMRKYGKCCRCTDRDKKISERKKILRKTRNATETD